jgi:cell division protein FtsA
MAKPSIITGLDVGTSEIKILVAEKKPKESELEVVSLIKEPAIGVRKGVVIGTEEVSDILTDSFEKIRHDNGLKINSVFLNVNGSHIFSASSHGTVAVSRADQKISEEDIERVFQAAQTFSLPSNKEIFDVFPKEFIVDGQGGIKEVLGLKGVRLEADVLALGGFSPYLKNLTEAILNSNLQILDRIPSPIASARAVLTTRQKELGVALIDIGAGTTGLVVFEEGDLIHLIILPIGSANITNDIAIGLKTDIDIAERIKIEYGSCSLRGNNKKFISRKKEKIEIGEDSPLVFSQKQLTNIIEPRVSEIFSQIYKELKKIGKEKLLPAGVVLTGGGAKLPKIAELVKKELKLPVKIGKPRGISGLDDSSLAVCGGLVLLGRDTEGGETFEFGEGMGTRIKKIFKIFIP